MRKDSFRVLLFAAAISFASPVAPLADKIEEKYAHASELLWKADLKGAQREFKDIVQRKPQYRSAEVLLGLTLAKLSEQSEKNGDQAGALAQLREALRFDPEEAYWHSALAKLLRAQGNGKEARKECARAAKLSPDDSDLARGCGFGGSPEIGKDKTLPYWRDLLVAKSSTQAIALYRPAPAYSEKARAARLQGTLALWLVVGIHGNVEEAAIDKPLGLGLDESALHAVRTWQFKPATLNGAPTRVRVDVDEISFHLF